MHGHSAHGHGPPTAGRVLHSARFYDATAYLMSFGRERRLRQETVERAEIGPGHAVLDVGCGTGSLTLAAREAVGAGGKVCGIDPSPEMIEAAKAKGAKIGGDVDFQLGVIESIPYPDASFDVVLSSLMLHHLPDELKRKGFGEVARVLRPGGRFFAVDLAPGSHGLVGHLMGLFRKPASTGLEPSVGALTDAGFTDIATGHMSFRLLSFISAKRH